MSDDILVLGKIEAKILEVQPQPIDLIQFCRDLIAENKHARSCNPIQFSSPHKRLIAHLDERLLRSIITNILLNAIRYTPAEKSIRLKASKRRNQLWIQIEDQGIGIPLDDQPHLFEPFHRGRNVSNIPGTGLGLSIVKQFIDLQQGAITVKSHVGIGSTFTIRLPLEARLLGRGEG